MPQDAVDHAGICNKGDDAHAAVASKQEGIRLKIFLIRRAHVLRTSLEKFELSRSGSPADRTPPVSIVARSAPSGCRTFASGCSDSDGWTPVLTQEIKIAKHILFPAPLRCKTATRFPCGGAPAGRADPLCASHASP
jgi:hypothetical protein